MKLIAASATLLAAINAQSVEVLLKELANKVYKVSDDGLTHTFNAAPYFQATYECLGEGFEGKGTFGNGNGVVSFTEKADWSNGDHFSYDASVEGSIKSLPWAVAYPAHVHDDTFEKNIDFKAGVQGFSYSDSGALNGAPYVQEISLTIEEISMTRTKMTAEIEFNRNSEISSSINQFWVNMAMPVGSTTANIVATAKTACSENPMNRACNAKLVITGDNNGQDFGRNVAKYSVQPKKAQFAVNHNKNEVFWMAVTGIDTMEVLALKYKVNGAKTVLACQFVGPAGMEAVAEAGQAFVTPFIAFVSAMNTPEDAVRAAVYADTLFNAAQGENYFNFYPVIKATKFESELIASALGVASVQNAARDMCSMINSKTESFLDGAAPVVSEARTYVHDVTGASGEAKFTAWFAQI
jgi:hypothetical protein